MSTNHRRVLAGIIIGLAWVAPLAAQNRLYVLEPDDKYHAVLKVSRGLPYIMEKGQPVAATGQRFALIKVEDYLPIYITVRDKQARAAAVILNDDDKYNKSEFHFSAKFESAYSLEDVFLVLEVEFSNVGKSIFVYEVGQLKPQTPKPLAVDLPMDRNLSLEQIKLHLFVGGTEVLHSEQPAAYREDMLDHMIAKRIASMQHADPRPFFGSPPEYPAALRTTGTRGEAVVTMRVTPRGAVQDPVVERASDPAFGEAALVAARQWRFLPQVEGGKAVEAKVSMPIAFDPPKAAPDRN